MCMKARGSFLIYTCSEVARILPIKTHNGNKERRILMVPRHQSAWSYQRSNQNAYFENQFGEKSIGEPKWKPHVRNALDHPDSQQHSPKGGNGLDWFSHIRCPKPLQHCGRPTSKKNFVIPQEKFNRDVENESRLIYKKKQEKQDWNASYEMSLEQRIGRRKKVQDVRNGIGKGAPGDKTYFAVEYEGGFHSLGSTQPVANFGASLKTMPDTFIPLARLPIQCRVPYHVILKQKEKENEIEEVKTLHLWKPAKPLGHD